MRLLANSLTLNGFDLAALRNSSEAITLHFRGGQLPLTPAGLRSTSLFTMSDTMNDFSTILNDIVQKSTQYMTKIACPQIREPQKFIISIPKT